MKKYVLVFLTMFAIMFAAGCTGSNPDYKQGNNASNSIAAPADDNQTATASAAATPESAPAPLTILDHKLGKEEYGGYTVTGTAQSSRDLTYAEVKVKFYDDQGALIESGLANINDLSAGEKWNFKVSSLSFDKHIADYKIAVGNCF